MKLKRNDLCSCGSGRKYKRCCGQELSKGHLAVDQGDIAMPTETQVSYLSALFTRGNHADLETAARSLIAQHPSSGYFWRTLGGALRAQGKDALDALRLAVEFSPNDAVALVNLGVVQSEAGQFEAAAANFRRGIAIANDFPEAHCNLGNALASLEKHDEALDAYRCALRCKPDYAHAQRGLGNVLSKLGRLDEAAACFRKVLQVKPDSADANLDLGDCLKRLGEFDEALGRYRDALKLRPECPFALVGLGQACLDQGKFDEARDFFNGALKSNSMMAEAWAGLAHCQKMTDAGSDWLAGAQRIAKQPMSPGTQATLLYAMGKVCDDIEQYDLGFGYCKQANAIKRSLSPAYDREARSRKVDRVMTSHPKGFSQQTVSGANLSERPIFIVGMPRSGTSLVEQIIASHPHAYGAGELRFWMEAGVADWEAEGDEMPPGKAGQLAADYLTLLDKHSRTALRVVDKMPFNFNCLGLIHTTFPNARILHTQRDPIDTCLSIYFQNFSAVQNFSHDLDDLAHYYREYRRLMAHWRSTLPPEVFLDLPYESLISDQEGETRRILDFIGLEWSDRCLSFHNTDRRVGTPSNWQARQPIYRTSRDRWHHYREHIGPLLRI